MTQSMSRVARCIDNGPMEGFWGILKRERYYGNRFTDRDCDSLVKMIEDYYRILQLQTVTTKIRNLDTVRKTRAVSCGSIKKCHQTCT